MNIGFTGHRPHKFSDPQRVRSLCVSDSPVFYLGGALGVDNWALEAILRQNKDFVLFLPFPPKVYASRWDSSDKQVLREGITRARSVSYVTPTYNISSFQKRNQQIVDSCELLVAFIETPESSGTKNCIDYALKTGKKVLDGMTDREILEF